MSISMQVTAFAELSPLWQARFTAAANSFAIILGCGIVLMLLLVFGYYITDASKTRKKDELKAAILDAVVRASEAKTPEEAEKVRIAKGRALFDRQGIAMLAQVFDSLNDDGREVLRGILFRMKAAKYINAQMDSTNEDYIVEIIRMIGDLDLVGLDSRIVALMYSYKNNVELQYQGFLALSRLGSRDYIIRICMDKNFVQTLSFRSLQQVLQVYSGDRPDLYAALISSPDPYIIRICIKRIGAEKVESLAPRVVEFLTSKNLNLVIDAVRTLGQLQYQPAAKKLVPLLEDARWEVRSMAVTAIAAIDRDSYESELIKALQDREWQVRYNAASALKDFANMDDIRQKVQQTGDRYALEMLEYMAQANEIWRRAE